MKKLTILLFSSVIIASVAISCKKAKVDDNTQTAVDNSISEGIYSRVFPTTNRIAIEEEGVKKHSTNRTTGLTCASIILGDTVNFPRTFTLDFGTGCVDLVDGNLREGKLMFTLDTFWNVAGAKMTIDFDKYKENGVEIGGSLVCQNNGVSNGGKDRSYSVSVLNGICKKDWEIHYHCNRTYKFTDIANTPNDISDDIVEISGDADGVDRDGNSYANKITKNIIKDPKCKYIQQGIIELNPEGLATRVVDYGDGTCDNKATVTINGNSFEFELR